MHLFMRCRGSISTRTLPEVMLPAVARLYSLPYTRIESNEQIVPVLKVVMADEEPCLCEVCGSVYFDEIPKSMTIANPDGTFTSSKLENLYPFVSAEEQQDNMPDWDKQ